MSLSLFELATFATFLEAAFHGGSIFFVSRVLLLRGLSEASVTICLAHTLIASMFGIAAVLNLFAHARALFNAELCVAWFATRHTTSCMDGGTRAWVLAIHPVLLLLSCL